MCLQVNASTALCIVLLLLFPPLENVMGNRLRVGQGVMQNIASGYRGLTISQSVATFRAFSMLNKQAAMPAEETPPLPPMSPATKPG